MDKLDNKMKAVLAVFDGYTHSPGSAIVNRGNRFKHIEDIPYDTDWSWVVPLYRKVMSENWDNQQNLNNETFSKWCKLIDVDWFWKYETPEPLAIALYNFITFHNEHNV